MGFSFRRILFRSWFYFRTGYGTYIALPVGVASNLVVLYELAVVKNHYLYPIFSSLTVFTLASLIVFVPVSIFAGLYHMKRTGAFAADASVQVESNPYIYKIIPGKEQEVLYPLLMLTAKGLIKVLDRDTMITPSEKQEFEEALAKANALLKGQQIGLPAKPQSATVSSIRADV
jgi:hypothetical protein